MHRHLLAGAAALVAAVALPAPALAIPSPFPVGSTWILSGTSTLDAPGATPASFAEASRESLSADGRYVALTSDSDGLSTLDDDRFTQVYVKDRATGALTLVSRRSGAGGAVSAGGGCSDPALSADGTRVAFVCSGPLDDADDNQTSDVYVRDWQAAEPVTTLASRGPALGPVGSAGSFGPSLSADGEYVAFASSNAFDAMVDTNGERDVYRRRIGSGNPVTLVSRLPGGVVGDEDSERASISDDGQRVAFSSVATNLGPGVATHENVFVADLGANSLTLASSPTLVNAYPNGPSTDPQLSGNGAVVAFTSYASDLQDGDGDTTGDVHTRTLGTSITSLVSVGATGEAFLPSIDADGSVAAYSTSSTGLDPADTGPEYSVYVREGGTTALVSRQDGAGGAVVPADAFSSALSASGSVVVFVTPPTFVTDGDGGQSAVFARDRNAQTTRMMSRPEGDAPFANDGEDATIPNSGPYVVSADGSRVVFTQRRGSALELVVRDTRTGARIVAGRADGANGTIDPRGENGVISADGNRVAWGTNTQLDPVLDTDDRNDIYVRDLATGRTFLASRADGVDGVKGNSGSSVPALDGDGSRVAFSTASTNLGDGPTGGLTNMHVRDLAAGRTFLASSKDGAPATGGNASAGGRPAISADGTRVAFASNATDLGNGDTDPQPDIHLRDLEAGTTRLVSSTPGGVSADLGASAVTMDASGTRLAFSSNANNLVEDFAGTGARVYLRDLAANTIQMFGRADGAAGAPAGASSNHGFISADGRSALFASEDPSLGAPDDPQLFLRDLVTDTTTLVSRTAGGTPVAESHDVAGLSADGACLVFDSSAPVIAAPVSPDFRQVYLRAIRPGCVPAPPVAPQPPAPGPGPGPGPVPVPVPSVTPGPPADRTAPRITRASLKTRRLKQRGRTTLRFTVSEASRLTVTVERVRPGRRVGRTCRAVSKTPRKGACKRYVKVRTLTRTLTKKGAQSVTVASRSGKRRLALGAHRLTLRATDRAGNRSKVVRLSLTVVRR